MEENKEAQSERITKLEQAINSLPIELQHIIFWAIENYQVLEKMGSASTMTAEQIQRAMEDALAKKNYATLILLYTTKFTIESKENEEI